MTNYTVWHENITPKQPHAPTKRKVATFNEVSAAITFAKAQRGYHRVRATPVGFGLGEILWPRDWPGATPYEGGKHAD